MNTIIGGITDHQGQSQSRIMTKMPHEILQHIGTMSTLPAAASMSLTCKVMMLVFGNQYAQRLLAKSADKLELVHLLARDLPYYVTCEECQTLHRGDEHEFRSIQVKLAKGLPLPACVVKDRKHGLSNHFSKAFDSITFRATMKRYRLGLEHLDLLSCFLKVLPRARATASMPEAYNNVHVSQQEVVPRIVNGRFLLRTQDWFIFSERDNMRWWSGLIDSICPHSGMLWSMGYRNNLRRWLRIWNAKDRDFLSDGEIVEMAKGRCTLCHTEWHLCARRLNSPGDSLVLTRWMDLGDGISDQDEQWKCHVESAESIWSRGRMRDDSESVGTLDSFFEGRETEWGELVWPANAEDLVERLAVAERRCEEGVEDEFELPESVCCICSDEETSEIEQT